MALTQVKTLGIADDAVTQDKVANDAIDITEIKSGTDGELITYDASGDPAKVAVGTSGHVLTSNGSGAAPTFQAASGGISDVVSDTSPQLGGDLDTNSFEISLDDSHKVKFGDGDDLEIYHDGTNNHIRGLNGATYIGAVEYVNIRSTDSNGSNAKWMLRCHNDEEVSLYYNDAKKFETTTNGVTVTGNLAVASGNGIDFSATSDATGMSNELLDDYEEGTWTPADGGGIVPFASATGTYTKVGNLVTLSVYLRVTANVTWTGDAYIVGLPFTSSGTEGKGQGGMAIGASNSGNDFFGGHMDTSSTVYYFYKNDYGKISKAQMWDGDSTAKYLVGTITYFT